MAFKMNGFPQQQGVSPIKAGPALLPILAELVGSEVAYSLLDTYGKSGAEYVRQAIKLRKDNPNTTKKDFVSYLLKEQKKDKYIKEAGKMKDVKHYKTLFKGKKT